MLSRCYAQWWDAQRKQYRPQVWSMVERLTRQGLYTQLDFRPKFSAGTSYCGAPCPAPRRAAPRRAPLASSDYMPHI